MEARAAGALNQPDILDVHQPSTRQAQAAVWTGTSMVIYGGVGGPGTEGAAYR